MKIGVDARCLAVPITGMGRYAQELLRRMPQYGHQWLLYSHRELINAPALEENMKICSGHISTPYLGSLWAQVRLPALVKRDGVDLFWSPRHHLPLVLPKKVKSVVTIHDLVWRRFPKTMRILNPILDSFLMPKSVRKADGVICISRATSMDLGKEMPKWSGKVQVIHEGVTAEGVSSYENFDDYGIGSPYILFVGTLEPRKNLKRLLQAYASLPGELLHAYQLVIVGGQGWGKERILELSIDLKIERKVRILGFLRDESMFGLMRHATVFAMPSLYEGFGLPLLDAMASRTAVLTSDTSSMPEVVGNAAYLVNPFDYKAIAQGLEILLSEADLRKRLIQNGCEQVKKFSWDKAARETLKFFEDVVAGQR